MFTLKLEMANCTKWIVIELLGELLSRVYFTHNLTLQAQGPEEINGRGVEFICHCYKYNANGQLMCQNDSLILYQGRIMSTNDRDSSDLLTDLEKWLSSELTINASRHHTKILFFLLLYRQMHTLIADAP